MTEQVAVITGGNAGIGKETAVALARAGWQVFITARDPGRGAAALDEIRSRSTSTRVDVAAARSRRPRVGARVPRSPRRTHRPARRAGEQRRARAPGPPGHGRRLRADLRREPPRPLPPHRPAPRAAPRQPERRAGRRGLVARAQDGAARARLRRPADRAPPVPRLRASTPVRSSPTSSSPASWPDGSTVPTSP